MSGRMRDRTALVLGGGVAGGPDELGNGKAAAVLLAREGARVVVADVVRERAENTVAAILAEGRAAHALECDVASAAAVSATVVAAQDLVGAIDVAVYNVGVGGPGPGLFAHDEAEWDRVFAVNTRGAFTTARAVIPSMQDRGHGRIVTIASTAALRITNGMPPYAYAASKAALIQLTQSIAIEFAADGIRANCVVPGMIDTPHASAAFRRRLPKAEADRIIEARAASSPTRTQDSAWDVANAVLFLAEDAVNYVNGVALLVDGGFTLATPSW